MIPLEKTRGVIFGWAKNAYRAPVGLILHLAAHLCWETVFVNAIELVPISLLLTLRHVGRCGRALEKLRDERVVWPEYNERTPVI